MFIVGRTCHGNKVIVMPSKSYLLASENYFAVWYLDESI